MVDTRFDVLGKAWTGVKMGPFKPTFGQMERRSSGVSKCLALQSLQARVRRTCEAKD